ncbi:hypothetical protein GCM10027563_42000 [Parasphingorhabdus pacifica]
MREQATKQPNSWLYVVDPIFTDPNAEIPPWGFIGGYRVDEQGELTDDFSPNPNYRPSPVALRLPAPNNDVERALQLTTTGYAQGQMLLTALLDAELILFAQPQGTGLFTLEHESGRRQLQLFTSDTYLPPNWTSWQRMTGRQLAAQSPAGLDLQINPTSPVKARIPGEDLIKAAGSIPPKVPTGPHPTPPTNGNPVPQSGPNSLPQSGPTPVAPTPQSGPAPSAGQSGPNSTAPAQPGRDPVPQDAVATTGTEGGGGPSSPADSDLGKRFIGSMLAGAIGDALGAAIEFYPVDQIRSRYGAQGVTDYDRSSDRPGEFTDDTQMTLFTLEGLIRGHIACRTNQADSPLASVQLAYQRWLHTQGYAWSRAVGPFGERSPYPDGWLVEQRDLFTVRSPNSDCITALREFASAGVPGTFEQAINSSQDCGGVVRAAPVALWSEDPRVVFELAAATAALTYADPGGYLPAGVLSTIVHQLIRGETLPDSLGVARALLVEYAGHEQTDHLLQVAQDLADKGKPSPEEIKDSLGSGWKGPEALAIAVCAALSSAGIASAVMMAVNHSGDSDSTGALCGNIVGAQYGSGSLPGVWLRDLKLRELVETVAKDGLAEFGAPPPTNGTWAARYPVSAESVDLVFTSTIPPVGAEPPVSADSAPSGDAPAEGPARSDPENDTVIRAIPRLGERSDNASGTSAEASREPPAASASAPSSASEQAPTGGDHGSAGSDPTPAEAAAAPDDGTDEERNAANDSESDPTTGSDSGSEAVSEAPTASGTDAQSEMDGQAEVDGQAEAGDFSRTEEEASADAPADSEDDRTSEPDSGTAAPAAEVVAATAAGGREAAGQDSAFARSGAAESDLRPATSATTTTATNDSPPTSGRATRIAGFLLGGAIGDALGYPIEDASMDTIREKYGKAGVTGLVDGRRAAGAISDGTQMMMFTTDGLIRASGRRRRYSETDPLREVQHAYQRWLHTQGFEWKDAGGPIAGNPPDGWLIRQPELFARRAPGATCVQALHGYAAGKPAGSLDNRPNASKGSGGITRAAPVGLWSDDPSEVFRVGCGTALLTHGQASGFLPAGVLAVIIQQLVSGRTLPEAVERALIVLADWDGHEETATAVRRAIELAAEDDTEPERINEHLGQGWTGAEALAIALCAALSRPKSFSDAVILAANHSGASDATAAICGTIMGAALTPHAMPPAWRDGVELGETLSALARDTALEFGPNPPDGDEWWLRYPLDSMSAEAAAHEMTEVESSSSDGDSTDEGVRQSDETGVEAVHAHTAAVASSRPEATGEFPESGAEAAASGTPATAVPAVVAETTTATETTTAAAETGVATEAPAASNGAVGEAGESDDDLSDEELRLLAAWRKFRDGDDDAPSDLSQGLHKLLVEAFGEERAAQLVGESRESEPPEVNGQLVAESPTRVNRAERFAGCVLGTAVGDALAAPWIFAGLQPILRNNPDGVREYTECFGARGAATALSQQAVFVLDGLIRAAIKARMSGSATNPAMAVQHTLQHWMCTQGPCFEPATPLGELGESSVLRHQRLPDETTLTALAQWGSRQEVPTAANPPNAARTPAATVRGAAVGLYTDTPASAVSLGAEIAVLTHGHPDGYLPAGALAGIASALQLGQTLAESVATVLGELDLLEGGERTARCLRAALELADHGPVSPGDLGALGLGWEAPEALALGVAAALSHPNEFADAVALAATHSGNSTATAAICGSLLGTARGVQAIPTEWVHDLELREVFDRLLSDESRIAADVRADQPAPDWAKRYLE